MSKRSVLFPPLMTVWESNELEEPTTTCAAPCSLVCLSSFSDNPSVHFGAMFCLHALYLPIYWIQA